MDVVTLSRIQFAITISFHYLYPPLSIGLGMIMVFAESLFLWTGQEHYRSMARFWTRVFALTFAMGVATGIVMEFQFGTNWARYSRFVGDIFGSALGAEGIFAFFLESGFLAILVFGWDRVGKGLHYFSTWMVCLGAHFSAVWIVVANSWMQTPTAYKIVDHPLGKRAEITDFWEMVFNPSALDRLTHTLLGCHLAGAFLVISISAWYALKSRHTQFAKDSLRIAIPFASVVLLLSVLSGHHSALGVAKNQPTKLAAFEGLFETKGSANLTLMGYVDTEAEKVYGISLPGMLSYFIYGDTQAAVTGLKEYPKDEWPPIQITFQSFHLMTAMWGMMVLAVFISFYLFKRIGKAPFTKIERAMWLFLVGSILFPMVANEAGWIAAEVGRQPWIVWGLLKTKDGISPNVDADMVKKSIFAFTAVYSLLFVLFLFLLNLKIEHGPQAKGSDEYRDIL